MGQIQTVLPDDPLTGGVVEAGWLFRACVRMLLLMPADCNAVGVLRLNRDASEELLEPVLLLLPYSRLDMVLFSVCWALSTSWVAWACVTCVVDAFDVCAPLTRDISDARLLLPEPEAEPVFSSCDRLELPALDDDVWLNRALTVLLALLLMACSSAETCELLSLPAALYVTEPAGGVLPRLTVVLPALLELPDVVALVVELVLPVWPSTCCRAD